MEEDGKFQEELNWCIEHLETILKTKKLSEKQGNENYCLLLRKSQRYQILQLFFSQRHFKSSQWFKIKQKSTH